MADSYSHLPERFRVAQQYRAAVIAKENAAVEFMAKRWQVSMRAIQADIVKVTNKIDKARSAGAPVNPDWLRRQSEYRQMQSQIIAQAKKFSDDVATRLRQETAWAARTGAHDAAKVTQLSFAEPIRESVNFTFLDDDVVLNIAGRVAPDSPTAKLISRMGSDTVAKTQDILVDGITRGRNVRVIGRDLAQASNLPLSRAQTIAKTEIFGAYRDTHFEHMKANQDVVKGWVWMAQIGTACGGCLAKHGDTYEGFATFLEAHPNCACEPIAIPKTFAELGLPAELDTLYPDPFNPAVMKADALKQLNVPHAELAKRFGPGKADLIKSGKIKLPQLAKRIDNDVWGAMITERPLKDFLSGTAPKVSSIPKPTIPKAPTTVTKNIPHPSTGGGIKVEHLVDGATKKEFDEAVSIIKTVHNPDVTLRYTGSKYLSARENGTFRRAPGDRVGTISIRNTNRATATAVHEIGHAIDFQMFDEPGNVMASSLSQIPSMNPKLGAWREAVTNSGISKKVNDNFNAADYKYHMGDNELWARSYEQYIATKSGNRKLIDAIQSSKNHWSKDDFAPILREMDRLFNT